MKLTRAIFIVFLIGWCTINCTGTHWKKRLEKYCALTKCQRYITSDNKYRDYLDFNDIANKSDGNSLQIRFFILTEGSIKFLLGNRNNSSSTETFPLSRFRRALTTFGIRRENEIVNSMSEQNLLNEKLLEHSYEFVFDDLSAPKGFIKSYVTKGSNQLKSLTSLGGIYKNEPNELLIEIFSDGKIRSTLNENEPLEFGGNSALDFISFVSPANQYVGEFFYNCQAD